MTSPVIDLVSRPDSPNVHRPLPTIATATTITTTTITTLPLPPQPQQGSSDPTLLKHIRELEQHIADLVDTNQAMEERLDKHGSRLYRLENQDIPNQVRKVVDEIVTDAVDWAMQAPLRECFRDLPEADIKEILHNRMWESKSYQTHEDHMTLYEALEKSMARDNSDQLLSDLAKARKKKKKRQGLPKTPLALFLIIHHQQVPLELQEPLALLGRLNHYLLLYLHPIIRVLSVSPIPEELHMDDDTTVDEQAYSSSGEDVGCDHIPTASALKSTYTPPPENLLLAQIGDMATFLDWYNVSKPLPLGGDLGYVTIQLDFFFNKDLEYLWYGRKMGRPALSISKMKAAYYPDVGLEQMVPDQMWIEEECKYDVAAMY
ncbi:hypothetical protein Tco_1037130, partial [Tanacetum coccineum]